MSFDGKVLGGLMPPKQIHLVSEWMGMHEKQLNDAWNKAVHNNAFEKIEPLK